MDTFIALKNDHLQEIKGGKYNKIIEDDFVILFDRQANIIVDDFILF